MKHSSQLALSVATVALGFAALAGEGPGTSVEEFYGSCVDCTIPGLAAIPARMKAGDVAGANKIFADYVRKTLRPKRLLRDWQRPASPTKRKALEPSVENTLAGKLTACGYTHDFKGLENVDWVTNRHPEKYCEWPWQLNRQADLTRLAEYYVRCERDEKVAAAWCKLVSGWIRQAPPPPYGGHPKRPVPWRTIDSGQRLEGWCRQIHAFIGSPALTDEFIVRFFRSVRDHGRRLEPSLTDNNWRIMELNGLMHAAVLFPFLSESAKWKELALAEYERQLELQQFPDGFHFELSPSYHGVIHGDYSKLIDLLRANGGEPSAAIMDGVERALDVYPHLTRPDRRSPAVNDSSEVSTIGTMMAARRLFPERADFTWFATGGKKGRAPDYLSYLFPYAGAAVFRSSWAEDAVWAYMDCSPFGRGHQHEDKLNVLMHAYGKNMIVDGGNYAYDRSTLRKYVVSTRAHNTIMVDGLEQNTKLHYRWRTEALKKKADVTWKAGGDCEIAEAAFTAGYGPEGSRDHTVHTRRLVFFRKGLGGLGPFFVVIDRLEAKDKARKARAYDSLWHLEECALDLKRTGFTADFGEGVGLTAEFSDREAKFADFRGSKEPFQGWLPVDPPNPHAPRAIPTPILRGTFAGAKRIVGVLHPHRGAESPIAGIRASPSVSSRAFTLVLRDGRTFKLDEEGNLQK